ncbi:MAG TPA: hypothetical protein VI197_12970 [Polyangiaceae bacterium]
MAYGMLVAAVVSAIMMTGLCFALGWRKVYMVAPLQFIAALAVTLSMGPLTVRDVYADDAFFLALIVSALMPLVFVLLRLVVGRLDKPDAGGLTGHAQRQARQRDFHP